MKDVFIKHLLLLGLGLIAVQPTLAAPAYRILHAFTGGVDGGELRGGIVFGRPGNIYGTTWGGGEFLYGTVFKLTRKPNGQWGETVLHSFHNGDPDGEEPISPLTFDAAGNLYGTTSLAGPNNAGTAFKMTHGVDGWNLEVLYPFCSLSGCPDSGSPFGGVVLDQAGNLYGSDAVVFQLAPGLSGWSYNLLYTFCSKTNCADGSGADARLIFDQSGNLFGTTIVGGVFGQGTVFQLHPNLDGTWSERVLHNFGNLPDGMQPGGGRLAPDGHGNFYGTTFTGGAHSCGIIGCGIVYKLSLQANGQWKETILYYFKPGLNGGNPSAGVVIDKAGNLYGTAGSGGDRNCSCGVVFKLTPKIDGTWSYSVLHRFVGFDGRSPGADLILDNQGNIYGTTEFGGPGGSGVVFEITP